MQVFLTHIPTGLCLGVYTACHTTSNTVLVNDYHYNISGQCCDDNMNLSLNTALGSFAPDWATHITKHHVRYDIVDKDTKLPAPYTVKIMDAYAVGTAISKPLDPSVVIAKCEAIASKGEMITNIDYDEGDSQLTIGVISYTQIDVGHSEWNEKRLQEIRTAVSNMYDSVQTELANYETLKHNEQLLRDIIDEHPDLAKRIYKELEYA